MSKSKILIVGTIAALLMALMAIPALAGGWAVLTLDELPHDIRAGEPVTVRFMIRQHGRTPLAGLGPVVQATQTETGQVVTAKAVDLPETGHYQAVFSLPEAGTWRWMIDGFGEHPLPDLQIQPAAANNPTPQLPITTLGIAAGFLVILLGGAFSILLLRRKQARPWAWSLLLVPILAGGLLVYTTQARSQDTSGGSHPDYASEYSYGEALFIAKGCFSCHTNTRIPDQYVKLAVSIGPNLSTYPQTAEFLRVWLKDPSAVKPGTQMPTLGLSDQEIEALIAFLINK